MSSPTVDGWRWMYDQVRRVTRTVDNPGAVTDDLIAYAFVDAENEIHDLAMESRVPWCVKTATIDDIGQSLGTLVEFQTYRYFIQSTLLILDCARVRALWRVDPANSAYSYQLKYIPTPDLVEPMSSTGASSQILGLEAWRESGDLNASGKPEQAVLIYNRGTNNSTYRLRVEYWYTPVRITQDTFYTLDASGNYTESPSLPRKVWPAIVDYAVVRILETTDDNFKSGAVWRRIQSKGGVLERLRSYFATFQEQSAEYGPDSYAQEGN